MTTEAMGFAWEFCAPDPLAKLVLLVFADGCDGVGEIDLDRMAHFCCSTAEDVDAAVSRLVDVGVLEKVGPITYKFTLYTPYRAPRGPNPSDAPSTAAPYIKKQIGQGLRMRVFERDDFTCKKCGARKDLTVDHIHPEVRGGTLDMDNLQTLCRPCNRQKGART